MTFSLLLVTSTIIDVLLRSEEPGQPGCVAEGGTACPTDMLAIGMMSAGVLPDDYHGGIDDLVNRSLVLRQSVDLGDGQPLPGIILTSAGRSLAFRNKAEGVESLIPDNRPNPGGQTY